MKSLFILVGALALSVSAVAAELTINAAEFGVGKFHRKDNQVQPYGKNHAWTPFILPDDVSTNSAHIMKVDEDTYTIFFTNLEELLVKMVEISKTTGKKISMVNLNAHGVPGGMWFPKDAKTRDSAECKSWKDAATHSDEDNYNDYYTPIGKSDIDQMNQLSKSAHLPPYNCLTGLAEWTAIVAKVPAVKHHLSGDARVHMHSCIVGKGKLGNAYTMGLARLLFPKPEKQQVQTSVKYGLGDWSMAEGMGFWDFESAAQLTRDNEVYPLHRRDSEIAQKGNIRVAEATLGVFKSGMIKDADFMFLSPDPRAVTLAAPAKRVPVSAKSAASENLSEAPPQSIRVPGTNVRLNLN
jgi:hypothetical protein